MCPFWNKSSILISGNQLYFTLFFALEVQIMPSSQSFWKSDFLCHCSFTKLFFIMLKNVKENLTYLWRSYKYFGVYNMKAQYLRKSPIGSQSWNFRKNHQCWKNLGMFPSSRFWDTFFQPCLTCMSTTMCGRHHHIKVRRNIWFKNLDDRNH